MDEIAIFPFGRLPQGREAKAYTITNSSGASVTLSNFGARVVLVLVPDKDGEFANVVLGYTDAMSYLKAGRYFGAVCGRYAGRISGASFRLDGKLYRLHNNDNGNCLHGGTTGFDARLFSAEPLSGGSIRFSYLSRHMEEGFPGNLDLSATYTFTEQNELSLEYRAVSDRKTVLNLTNHTYFNLDGDESGSIENHVLRINAGAVLELDEEHIPTGKIMGVKGTAFDFSLPRAVGERINAGDAQLLLAKGYDHCYLLDSNAPCAALSAPISGRTLEVYTDMPALQLYTGNYLGLATGRQESKYVFRGGVCLETQQYTNAVNNPDFPTTALEADTEFVSRTVFKFGTV